MRIATIQMDVLLGGTAENLNKAVGLVRKAAELKPDVIILPEMWNTGYDLPRITRIADREGNPSARRMGELAKEFGINIIAGSIADLRGDQVYNTSYVFDRSGEQVAEYSKIHLFGLMKEGEYLASGDSRCTFALDGVKCGLMICYELRFPELARALALDGAEVIFVPAQWPQPRMHPWRILVQARAVENQLYVVAVNRVGNESKVEFFGHSMVVDPLGDVMYEGNDREQINITDLDLQQVTKIRNKMTCFKDRVEKVYY
ncbi:MAG: carbon-nitrogen family hydrolase [Peptococcaceae bacterium]